MCLIYARHSSESFKYLFIKSVHLHNNTVIIIPLASSVAQLVKNLPAMQETPVQFLGQEDLLRRDRLPTPVFLGFLGGSDSKESACNVGCLGLIPGMGRFPGKGNGYPCQYSCLENSVNRGAWQATVHRVTKSNMTEQLSL